MSAGSTAVLLAAGSELFDLLGLGAPSQWQIYEAGTSDPAIMPDTIEVFGDAGDARVARYPLEQGAFANFNKVQEPKQMRLLLVCSGEAMSIGDFLQQLEVMRLSTDLNDIATPDILYENLTLTHYDTQRRASSGVTMIRADCRFEEIRQAADPTYSTSPVGDGATSPVVTSDSPAANSSVNTGSAQTFPLGSNPSTIGPFQ
jgi:hypothetical protein